MDLCTRRRQNFVAENPLVSLSLDSEETRENDGLWSTPPPAAQLALWSSSLRQPDVIRCVWSLWQASHLEHPPLEPTCVWLPQLLVSVCYSLWASGEDRNKAQSHTGLHRQQRFEALAWVSGTFLRSWTKPPQGCVTGRGVRISAPSEGGYYTNNTSVTVVICSHVYFECCHTDDSLVANAHLHWHTSCCYAFWDLHQ